LKFKLEYCQELTRRMNESTSWIESIQTILFR